MNNSAALLLLHPFPLFTILFNYYDSTNIFSCAFVREVMLTRFKRIFPESLKAVLDINPQKYYLKLPRDVKS